jgi:hypothetical protein
VQFRYHGDFDWGGIRIASAVRRFPQDRAVRRRQASRELKKGL